MTTISILPEQAGSFRAVAGTRESIGRTADEALDLLTPQLDDESGTLVIFQNRKPDAFFNHAQQKRLTELMRRRATVALTQAQESELDGARRRSERLAGGLLP